MVAIPSTSQHADVAMQFLNMMYNDTELLDMMVFGVPGDHVDLRRGRPR